MGDLIENSSASANINRDVSHKNYQMKKSQNDWKIDLYSEFISWKEESQRQFSNIIDSHSNIIDTHSSSIEKTINELLADVGDLQAQLSVITKERNDLLKTVKNLRGDVKQVNENLSFTQTHSEPEDYYDQSTEVYISEEEVSEVKEEDTERTRFSTEPDNQVDHIDNANVAVSTVRKHQEYPTNDDNHFNYSVFNQMADDYVQNAVRDEEVTRDNSDGGERQEKTVMRVESKFSSLKSNCIKRITNWPVNLFYLEECICPECKVTFSTHANLRIHLKNVHSQNETSQRVRSEELWGQGDLIKRSEVELKQDIKIYDNQLTTQRNNPEGNEKLIAHTNAVKDKEVKKEECGHTASDQRALMSRSHNNMGGGKFKCEQCPYQTAYQKDLTRHLKGVHEKIKKVKSHVCRDCNYTASENSKLRAHINAVHENFKKFNCEQCAYTAAYKGALRIHIKGVHDNMRMKCEHCPYETSNTSNLNKHIRGVHEKIKNHACKVCGYAALLRGDLKKHIAAVHEGIRKHVCGECTFASSEKSSLRKHKETMHNNYQ